MSRSMRQSNSSVMTFNRDNTSYLNDSRTPNRLGTSLNEKVHYSFKVILVGGKSVGKTSVIQRFFNNSFEENLPATINMDLKTKSISVDANTSVDLKIWDTCGEEKFKSLTKQYYKDSNGIILMYDVNDLSSFENVSDWLKDCKSNSEEAVEYFLVGNKIDLERKVSIEDVQAFSKEHNLPFKDVSAYTGLNVLNVFDNLVKNMVNRATLCRDLTNFFEEKQAKKLDKTYNEIKGMRVKPKSIGCC